MDKFIKQLEEVAKKVSLSEEEVLKARDNLVLFMKDHPVRYVDQSRQIHQTGSNLSSLINNKFKFKISNFKFANSMPIFILIALLVGGGASVSAESALPGDPLYAIKVNVNEEVREALTLSAKAKAEWQAERAERRLEEAEELAAKGQLSAEALAKIEANFKKHADKVADRIEKFEEKDMDVAAEVVSNFEASLRAHERILNRLAQERGTDKDDAVSLSAKVRAEADSTKKDRLEIETKLSVGADVRPAAEGKMKAAENKIEEVRKYIERNKEKLGAEATVQAVARLKAAEDLVVAGKAKLEAKAYGEAFVLFQKAHTTAQASKLLIEARKDLDVKVHLNGSSDSSGGSEVKSNSEAKVDVGDSDVRAKSKLEIDFGF